MFFEGLIATSRPYSGEGIILTPDQIQTQLRAVINEITKGMTALQSKVTKLLWGYYGMIFTEDDIVDMLDISHATFKKIERQVNQTILHPERVIHLRKLYEVAH